MPRPEDKREFLMAEYQANRTHADHINDHRLQLLGFFTAFTATFLGIGNYVQVGDREPAIRQTIFVGLLSTELLFGVLSLLVLSNYWVSRDFLRYRNKLAEEEMFREVPDTDRYFEASKEDLPRIPALRGMFGLVSLMIALVNEIVGFLLLQSLQVERRSFVSAALSGFLALQIFLIFGYRSIFVRRRKQALAQSDGD